MDVTIRKNIHEVQPMKMLWDLIDEQRESFLKRKEAILSFHKLVPPYIEKLIAEPIKDARQFYSRSISWKEGTGQIKARVRRSKDPSNCRTVKISENLHKRKRSVDLH